MGRERAPAPPPEPEKKRTPRSALVAAGLLAASGAGIAGHEYVGAQPEPDLGAETDTSTAGDSTRRAAEKKPGEIKLQFEKKIPPPPQIEMAILEYAKKQVRAFLVGLAAEHGDPTIKDAGVEAKIELTNDGFHIKPIPEAQRGQVAEQVRIAIEDALQFWDDPRLPKPIIDIQTPGQSTDVFPKTRKPLSQDPNLTMVLAEEVNRVLNMQIKILVNGQYYTIPGQFSMPATFEGATNSRVAFNADGGIITGASMKRSSPIMAARANPGGRSNIAIVAPSEVLHMQIAAITDRLITRALNGQRVGSPAEANALVRQMAAVEEAVVHAIGRLWANEFVAKGGVVLPKGAPTTADPYPRIQELAARFGPGRPGVGRLLDTLENDTDVIRGVVKKSAGF